MKVASIYKQAPDLLLNKLAEVNGVLVKQDKNHSAYKFWKDVADVMKFAYAYIMDLSFVVEENTLLRAENDFLKKWATEVSKRLEAYETIKAEKLAGTFEETVKRVEEQLNG